MLTSENIGHIQEWLEDFEQVWPLFESRGYTKTQAIMLWNGITAVMAFNTTRCHDDDDEGESWK